MWGRSLLGVMKMGFALGVAGLWEKKTAISPSPAEIFFPSRFTKELGSFERAKLHRGSEAWDSLAV